MVSVGQFFTEGSLGHVGHNSLLVPFYTNHPITKDSHIVNDNGETEHILHKLPLNSFMKNLYRHIKHFQREFYFNNWTIMSLESLKDRYDLYKKNGQHKIIDFAFKHIGMGHIIMVSFDIITFKIFFRNDGGSNVYERDIHWKFIKSYIPLKNNNLNFNIWIDLLLNKRRWTGDLDLYSISRNN